jgi:hypothetical protein
VKEPTCKIVVVGDVVVVVDGGVAEGMDGMALEARGIEV